MSQPRRGGARKRASALKHTESEDLTTRSVEVARFWLAAYDELVNMEEQLLGQLEAMLSRLSPAARREAELTNVPMINDRPLAPASRGPGRSRNSRQNRDLGAKN